MLCRYAEYETKLEELRAHRKDITGLKGKTTLADYAIVRRIHNIYERATRKFRGDLRVWLKWLHFCRSSGSTRQISRVGCQHCIDMQYLESLSEKKIANAL